MMIFHWSDTGSIYIVICDAVVGHLMVNVCVYVCDVQYMQMRKGPNPIT